MKRRKNWVLLLPVFMFTAVVLFAAKIGKDKVSMQAGSLQETMAVPGNIKTSQDTSAKEVINAGTNTNPIKETPVIKSKGYYKKLYKTKKAFTIVNITGASKKQARAMFYKEKITNKIFKRIYGKSYKKDCTVPKKDLRYIRVLHYGFDKKVHIGELITNKAIAKDICDIFYELYKAKYQIEKMVLVDEYNASDNLSMADNNTSCFNFRTVSGTQHLSKHSYGMAIDINPRYNPYIHSLNGVTVCEPENGSRYQDRSQKFKHKITSNDLCYKVFMRYGFTWGGEWINSKDYQHFQK